MKAACSTWYPSLLDWVFALHDLKWESNPRPFDFDSINPRPYPLAVNISFSLTAETIILSYAFKMRQDYLSTSYLDQKYLPSERSERGRYELIQVTCAEIILSHFESIWWYFSHTFHYLTDEISWKYERTCQSGTWMLVPPICVRLTFSPRTFTRITLAMCVCPTLPT